MNLIKEDEVEKVLPTPPVTPAPAPVINNETNKPSKKVVKSFSFVTLIIILVLVVLMLIIGLCLQNLKAE